MIGTVESFDENIAVKFVETLVEADEVERALLIIDNLPAFYRDNPPLKLQQLKRDILSSMVTAHAYLSSDLDANVVPDACPQLVNSLLRGILVQREISRYNKQGKTPHIVDIGPGEYFIPIGLQRMAMRFTYWDVGMDQKTARAAHPIIQEVRLEKAPVDQPLVFLALEVIEHVSETKELAVEALRHCGRWPDRVHLSTPCYTFDGRRKSWRKPCGLPHLRAYTPREFMAEAGAIFSGYHWDFFSSQIMSLRGCRLDKLDPEPLYQPEGVN